MTITSIGGGVNNSGGSGGSVFDTAVQGLRQAAERAGRDAESIVRGPVDPAVIVDLNAAALGFKASAAMVRTGDEMQRTLLDIIA